MNYQVAVDPGLTATGWALFSGGKALESGTIRPRGTLRLDKLISLTDKLRTEYRGAPEEVTIEQWEGHSPVARFQTMLACAEARGIIFAVSHEFTDTVQYLSKGKSPKSQADLLANSLGITGSEHARDAVHLGYLAGYYYG
jgi:Holliday junction resolvasome RuvABC endonuclease subunit